MEENKTWSFAVLEDSFGLVAAVQILDKSRRGKNLMPLELWVARHYEGSRKSGQSDGWEKLFASDEDSELNEVPTSLGKPESHGLTYRECRDNLLAFLESKQLRCYKTDDTLGGSICVFYIKQTLRSQLESSLSILKNNSQFATSHAIAVAKAPWYEYVRDELVWQLAESPEDRKAFGRYILTTPKFEELFNQIHAEYDMPVVTQSAPSNARAPKSDNAKIKQQQAYVMMMAPNGRCPKCNHPLNTRNVGLSAGKGAAGAFLAGTAGAIVGAAMGRKEYYCPACGYVR